MPPKLHTNRIRPANLPGHKRPPACRGDDTKEAGGEALRKHIIKALKRSLRFFSRPFDHDYYELDSILAFLSRSVHDLD
jgi:hypothetical protein